MRLEKVQNALDQKNIKFEYTEEDGCGSLDFMFRGLSFHVWAVSYTHLDVYKRQGKQQAQGG